MGQGEARDLRPSLALPSLSLTHPSGPQGQEALSSNTRHSAPPGPLGALSSRAMLATRAPPRSRHAGLMPSGRHSPRAEQKVRTRRGEPEAQRANPESIPFPSPCSVFYKYTFKRFNRKYKSSTTKSKLAPLPSESGEVQDQFDLSKS